MRRMNYNPLNNVYASGEYSKQEGKFLLDKYLERGHLYLAQIMNTELLEMSTTIIDLSRDSDVSIAPLIATDLNDEFAGHYLFVQSATLNNVDFSAYTSTMSNYPFVIYIYQLI